MRTVFVTLIPEGRSLEVSGAKTALSLLGKLDRKPARALVIREEPGGPRLLTPDVTLNHGDRIEVRDVWSRG